MSPFIATFIYALGVLALLVLDRDRKTRTSKALWLPFFWICITGSRPISVWLGINQGMTDAAFQSAEGSPFDASVFALLLAAGIIVLISRKTRTSASLKASWPILIYFAYCLLSVLWSDFPDIALKRWIKAIGDLVMVLVLVTDTDPVATIERVVCRAGFILMPTSILLSKYFESLGRGYDPVGNPVNIGVAENKNMLGVITLVISLGALWSLLRSLLDKNQPNRARHLLARGTLLAFCVTVLSMADSATSKACFTLGAVLVLASYLPLVKRRPGAVHVLVAMIVLSGGLTMLLGGQGEVVHALGRKSNLTDRTEIWAAVLPVIPNRLVGAGFESFWLGPRVERVWSNLSQYMHVNEAHNGYIEVYLNLGWVGVGLIAVNLIGGYRGSVAAFRRDPVFGGLMLAYVAAAAIYSITEAGFRMLDPIWIFLLLAVVGAHSVASGVVARAGHRFRLRERHVRRTSASDALASAR
jgi:exopolysaccharide production protein ExoQ